MYRLKKIEIENFRGFQKQQTFKTEGFDFIILKGDNGLGKTSLFDAIEWGLTGALKRYDRGSRERNSQSFLSNRFSDKPGQIKLKFTGDNQDFTLKRMTKMKGRCDYNPGLLKVDGQQSDDLNELLLVGEREQDFNFNEAFNFSHFLGQEVISDFVRTYKETERYSILNKLVGVNNYSQYRDRVRSFRQQLKKIKAEKEKQLDILTEKIKAKEKEVKVSFKEDRNLDHEYDRLKTKFKNILEQCPVDSDLEKIPKNIKRKELKTIILKFANQLDDNIKNNRKQLTQLNQLQQKRKQYQKDKQTLSKLKKQISKTRTQKQALEEKQKLNYLRTHKDPELGLEALKTKLSQLQKQQAETQTILKDSKESELGLKDKSQLLFKENSEVKTLISNLEDEQQQLKDLKKKFKHLTQKIESLQDLSSKLLNSALDYIKQEQDEKCPVCLQPVNKQELETDLEERLEIEIDKDIKPYLQKKSEIKKKVLAQEKKIKEIKKLIRDQIKEYRQKLVENYEQRKDEIKNLKNIISIKKKLYRYQCELGITGENDLDKELAELENKYEEILKETNLTLEDKDYLENRRQELKSDKEKTEEMVLKYERLFKEAGVEDIEKLEDVIKESTDRLKNLKDYRSQVEGLKDSLVEQIKYIKESQAKQEYKNLKEKKKLLEKKVDFLQKRYQSLKELESKVPRVINQMTAEILEPYREIANDIYGRINPHLIFTRFDWKRDSTGQNNGTLRLSITSADGEREANPSYIYSSSQINIIVLSLFLSFALRQNWSRLDSIFLDDPIQTIDDINIFSFVDVLRAICLQKEEKKQIFLSTHDRKFYQFLRKKLRMFEVLVLDFKSYGREGPGIQVKELV